MEQLPNRRPTKYVKPSSPRSMNLYLFTPSENYFPLPATRKLLAESPEPIRYIRHDDHEFIVFPILLISPRSQACAASVLTRGCQIIRYLKPVISAGALSTLIRRFSDSIRANRWGAVRISLVPGMHRVAAPK